MHTVSICLVRCMECIQLRMWLALDKVLVPDIHMILSVGSFTLSEL